MTVSVTTTQVPPALHSFDALRFYFGRAYTGMDYRLAPCSPRPSSPELKAVR